MDEELDIKEESPPDLTVKEEVDEDSPEETPGVAVSSKKLERLPPSSIMRLYIAQQRAVKKKRRRARKAPANTGEPPTTTASASEIGLPEHPQDLENGQNPVEKDSRTLRAPLKVERTTTTTTTSSERESESPMNVHLQYTTGSCGNHAASAPDPGDAHPVGASLLASEFIRWTATSAPLTSQEGSRSTANWPGVGAGVAAVESCRQGTLMTSTITTMPSAMSASTPEGYGSTGYLMVWPNANAPQVGGVQPAGPGLVSVLMASMSSSRQDCVRITGNLPIWPEAIAPQVGNAYQVGTGVVPVESGIQCASTSASLQGSGSFGYPLVWPQASLLEGADAQQAGAGLVSTSTTRHGSGSIRAWPEAVALEFEDDFHVGAVAEPCIQRTSTSSTMTTMPSSMSVSRPENSGSAANVVFSCPAKKKRKSRAKLCRGPPRSPCIQTPKTMTTNEANILLKVGLKAPSDADVDVDEPLASEFKGTDFSSKSKAPLQTPFARAALQQEHFGRSGSQMDTTVSARTQLAVAAVMANRRRTSTSATSSATSAAENEDYDLWSLGNLSVAYAEVGALRRFQKADEPECTTNESSTAIRTCSALRRHDVTGHDNSREELLVQVHPRGSLELGGSSSMVPSKVCALEPTATATPLRVLSLDVTSIHPEQGVERSMELDSSLSKNQPEDSPGFERLQVSSTSSAPSSNPDVEAKNPDQGAALEKTLDGYQNWVAAKLRPPVGASAEPVVVQTGSVICLNGKTYLITTVDDKPVFREFEPKPTSVEAKDDGPPINDAESQEFEPEAASVESKDEEPPNKKAKIQENLQVWTAKEHLDHFRTGWQDFMRKCIKLDRGEVTNVGGKRK